jgi:hypothetical protein
VDKFWELFQESVIVQSMVTLILVITLCAMFISGQAVPDLLAQITLLVIGFWFGSKSQQTIMKASKVGK